jgi:hypothetical protein
VEVLRNLTGGDVLVLIAALLAACALLIMRAECRDAEEVEETEEAPEKV